MSVSGASWSRDELDFRREVSTALAEIFDERLRSLAARQAGIFAEGELQESLHRALYNRGWIAPAWPKEYGGPGWNSRQRAIFAEAYATAGLPKLPSFGLSLCAPVIMKYGTAAQKTRFLPRILSNEYYFCQGYSEPGAGSDLASLQCRAERRNGHYVVNGAKIWTTHAHHANWMFMLVRTSAEGRRQDGITFLLTPLDAAGISVRPIISISGEHEVNEVFFDAVEVPVENRLGEENGGWAVAKNLLEFERGSAPVGATLFSEVKRLRALAMAAPGDQGRSLLHDATFRHKVAAAEIEALAANALDQRLMSQIEAGESLGDTGASIKKLQASEKGQRLTELSMEALGAYAAVAQRRASNGEGPPLGFEGAATPTAKYLNSRATSIFGGSSEIQRNILARMLGL